jgi:hemerythrin-like domain-containing protein
MFASHGHKGLTVIAAWHAEHMDFLRLLDQLEKQVSVFQRADRPDYDLMLDIIRYLRDFPDQLHHPREDAAFARLAQKYPGMELAFARLHQEHRVIANAGQALLEVLEAAVGGAMVSRSDVESAAATYLAYYRNHIHVEEKEVLCRAAESLTSEDWADIAAALPLHRSEER